MTGNLLSTMPNDAENKKDNKTTTEQPAATSRRADSFKRFLRTTTILEDNTAPHAQHVHELSNGSDLTSRSAPKSEHEVSKEDHHANIPLIRSSSSPSSSPPPSHHETDSRRDLASLTSHQHDTTTANTDTQADPSRGQQQAATHNGDPSSFIPPEQQPLASMNRNQLKRRFTDTESTTTIHLGNIPYSETESELKAFLEQEIGPVNRIEIQSDRSSLGIALVKFEKPADATQAVERLNEKSYKTRTLTAKMNKTYFDDPEYHHLYVRNLPGKITWRKLKELFRPAGGVISANIKFAGGTQNEASEFPLEVYRGWVTFSSKDNADNALAMFQDFDFKGHKIRITRNGPIPPLFVTYPEILRARKKREADEIELKEQRRAKARKEKKAKTNETKKAKKAEKAKARKDKKLRKKRGERIPTRAERLEAELEARLAAAATASAAALEQPPPPPATATAPEHIIASSSLPFTSIPASTAATHNHPPITAPQHANTSQITGKSNGTGEAPRDQEATWQQLLLPSEIAAAVTSTLAMIPPEQQQQLQQLDSISATQAMTALSAIAASGMSFIAHLISGPGAHLPPRGPHQIYVTNLPLATTSQDLVDLFVHVGPVLRTEILWYQGQPRGEGLVRFEHPELPKQAIERFNGYLYGGQELTIYLDNGTED
ncbi:hypothetical protein BCR42DRAFT_456132 [Absidia repens]|uniref:RRM domain-containing protein n=1 Tax=Absidia repens TaxID=90262 RepID=A0A1X2I2P7_9FUNG|nr:hypothetical protein BCR42DRAFT_456132 [Absidia repens]